MEQSLSSSASHAMKAFDTSPQDDYDFEYLESPIRREPPTSFELNAGFHDPPLRPPSPQKAYKEFRRQNKANDTTLEPISTKKNKYGRVHKAFRNLPDANDVRLGPLPKDVLAELKERQKEMAKHLQFLNTKKEFYQNNTGSKVRFSAGGGEYDCPLLEHAMYAVESHMISRRHRARFEVEPQVLSETHKDYRTRTSANLAEIQRNGYPTKKIKIDEKTAKKLTPAQIKYEREMQRMLLRRERIRQNKKKQQQRERVIRQRAEVRKNPELQNMLKIKKPSKEEVFKIGLLETRRKYEQEQNLKEARNFYRMEDTRIRIELRKARNKARTEGIDLEIKETGIRGFILTAQAYTKFFTKRVKRLLGIDAMRRFIRDVEITMIMWGLTEENLRDNLRWLGIPVAKYKRRRPMTARQRLRWYVSAAVWTASTAHFATSYVVRYIYCLVTGERFVARPVSSSHIKDAFETDETETNEESDERSSEQAGNRRNLKKERRFTFTAAKWEAAEAAEAAAKLREQQQEMGIFEEGEEESGSDVISYFNEGESVSHNGESLDGSIERPFQRASIVGRFISPAGLKRIQRLRDRLEELLAKSETFQILRSQAIEAQQRMKDAAAPQIEKVKNHPAYIKASEHASTAARVMTPHAKRFKARAFRASVYARDKSFQMHESVAESEALRRGRTEAEKIRRAIAESEAARHAAWLSKATKVRLGVHLEQWKSAKIGAKKKLAASPALKRAYGKFTAAKVPLRTLKSKISNSIVHVKDTMLGLSLSGSPGAKVRITEVPNEATPEGKEDAAQELLFKDPTIMEMEDSTADHIHDDSSAVAVWRG